MVLPKRLTQRRVAGLAEASLMVALLTCGHASISQAGVTEEQGAAIGHTALQCWPAEEHIVLSADIQPSGDVQKSLLYFRWDRHAAWYFVPMVLNTQGLWVAVLPKTLPGTTGAVYHIESLSSSYTSTRSPEYRVPVMPAGNCENPAGVIYTGNNPNITVGATRAGQPVPPGFDVSSIGAYISPTGVTTGASTGGGISGKTLAIIGGAGGGAAAAVFATGGSNGDPTTTNGIGAITTTIGSTTTPGTGGGPSSTSTTSAPNGNSTSSIGAGPTTSIGGVGSTTTLPGQSTTTLPGPSTTTLPGPSTTTLAGPSTTTLLGTSTTTTIAGPTTTTSTPATTSNPTSSTTTTIGVSGADMWLMSISSAPDPVGNGVFAFTITVRNIGPNTAPSAQITLQMPNSDRVLGGVGCSGGFGFGQCTIGTLGSATNATRVPKIQLNGSGSHTITATVGGGIIDPVLGNNSASHKRTISFALRSGKTAQTVEILSTLDVPPRDARIRSSITLNDAESQETNNSGPRVHRFSSLVGVNRIEAQADLGQADSGTWRFDLARARNLAPGTVRIESGQPISRDANSVTFAIEGGANTVRFSFELVPE